jgi:hypothetical protein
MIDTINFKLNNVSKYPITRTQYEARSTSGETTFAVDESTGEIFNNSKVRAIMYHDSDTIIPLSKRAKLHIASSNYLLSYFYNITGDFINFEFSIPKYMYGTNIIQFIRYFNQDSGTIYDMLMEFMRDFFQKHTYDAIDFKDVELTRIDLCYNQFFMSKLDALKYLQGQKELLQKNSRTSKNKYRTYETSLLYVTKRYSFKIYHKGEEFKVNDRKELAKKNPTGHSITELQDISNKILRYEVTFRKAQIDYLFEKNEFHNKYLGFLRNEATRKSARLLSRDHYDHAIQFTQQSKHFLFAPIKSADAIQMQSVFFDQPIFNALFEFFWDLVNKYQLTRKKSLTEVIDGIRMANEKKGKAVSKNLRGQLSFNEPMLVALTLLTEHMTLAEIKKMNVFTEPTFYRYKAKLKQLGVDDETRLTDIPPPTLGYIDYKYYFGKHHIK